ncbi:MAG: TldD/PmbA family protein [Thermoplasmata archaeon]
MVNKNNKKNIKKKEENKRNKDINKNVEISKHIDIDALKKLADYAVKKGASEAEVFALAGSSAKLSIEKNYVNFASSKIVKGIGIRVIMSNRLGFSYATDLSKGEDAVEKALALSRLGDESKYSFPEIKKYPDVKKLYDKSIPELTPEAVLDIADEMVDSARSISPKIDVTSGAIGYGEEFFAIVNTNGVCVECAGTEIGAQISTVMKDKTTTTGSDYGSSRLFKKKYLDVSVLGKNAAKLALETQDAKKLDKEAKIVVFTPMVVSNFAEFLIGPALVGDAVSKGESPYSGKIGSKVAVETLSIIDDGVLENGLNSAYMDDEGVPSQKNELIVNGILKNFIYSSKDAFDNKTKSSGNAMRCERFSSSRTYRAPPTVKARNLILSAKGKTYSLDKMIKEIDNGVVVYDVMGAHTANPASCDFSVNSSTLFKIEHGKIAYPIKQAMLSGNIVKALENIVLFGSDVRMLPGSLTPTCVVTPSIAFEGIKVTG